MNWTPWNGGACPVDPDCQVKYRMRNQRELGDDEYDIAAAGDLDWGHKGNGGSQLFSRGAEIVAYKIASQQTALGPIEAWVGEMKTSKGMEYYVCVGRRTDNPFDRTYMTPQMYLQKGRAEFDVAEWNAMLNGTERPNICDYDTDTIG